MAPSDPDNEQPTSHVSEPLKQSTGLSCPSKIILPPVAYLGFRKGGIALTASREMGCGKVWDAVLTALEALRNALYKCSTYLLTY